MKNGNVYKRDTLLDQIPPSAFVEIGVARRDITPPIGIYARQWGAATHDVIEGIHRPFTATAMAMRGNSSADLLVLVVLDAGWWPSREDEWLVRGHLIESLNLAPHCVMVCCTHTHSGVVLCRDDADKPGGYLIEPYLCKLRDAVHNATCEAIEKCGPATLTWATGRCDLARNRDLSGVDGNRIVCGYNPSGDADDTLLVGRVTDASGIVIATLVNYACHPTTLAWDNRLASPDYVGALREVVERHTNGAPCLFLQGASGELAPREQYLGNTDVVDANGRRAGFASIATLESMLPPKTMLCYRGVVESGAPLAIWHRRSFEPPCDLSARCIEIELPLKLIPGEEELQRALDICTDRTMAERLQRQIRARRVVGNGQTLNVPIWIWRVGRSLFVGQMNEAYSVLQIALRRRFPEFAVVVMNLVNGTCGYLSPPELYDKDIYQVWQSPFAPDALPRVIETCESQIARMLM